MYSIVYTTFPDSFQAHRLIDHLLEDRSIACANVFNIESKYRWQGEIVKEQEIGVFLKTRKELVEKVIKTIEDEHPYDIPCAVELPLGKGSHDYLGWLREETSSE